MTPSPNLPTAESMAQVAERIGRPDLAAQLRALGVEGYASPKRAALALATPRAQRDLRGEVRHGR